MGSMATWIIGDIHGCFETLERLLDRIQFDRHRDRVIQVGDLVNKGPMSLEVLRWAMGLGDRFQMVLGNHEIHLLARAAGFRRRKEDTLDGVLDAPDRDVLVSWLQDQPLVLKAEKTIIVHAGFMPSWSLDQGEALAGQCERALQDGKIGELYERRKIVWSEGLENLDRIAAALSVMTRIRTILPNGRPLFGYWGPVEEVPDAAKPWFEGSSIPAPGSTVVFGHWATLGIFHTPGVICLDSGCVYGGSLSAFRIEDGKIEQVPASE
jgi:bis(5'-nucleosyl)-tetraphosphatase (symmetrical)